MDIERQARLDAILENAVDAIITIDARGTIQDVNPATTRLFGYLAEEMVGQNVSLLMPTPYREEHDGYLQNYHDTGQRKIIGVGREVMGQRKDGSTFPIHLAVSEFRAGHRQLFTGIVRDISDLKAVEAELNQLNDQLEQRIRLKTQELKAAQAELVRQEKLATLGQLSGGIAHEIRNPLNAVKTSAYYLLHAPNPTEAKTKEHLQRIDRQVALIDNVVTALSDVARLPEPDKSRLDAGQLLHNAVHSMRLADTIEVKEDFPRETALEIEADEQQLSIVFRNLLRNAQDAMPNGGQLTVGSKLDQEFVAMFVTDTGCGISPDDLARITEPMYTTKAQGMGLGLAISKTIIEKNGGQLQIESQLGHGSTFSVLLPAASDPKLD